MDSFYYLLVNANFVLISTVRYALRLILAKLAFVIPTIFGMMLLNPVFSIAPYVQRDARHAQV